jgi:hypothetical protein
MLLKAALLLWIALCAGGCAKPNPLPGRWEGANSLTGKQVYWEFEPGGRLFTNNFAIKQEYRYRVELPDTVYISFFGKFEQDSNRDELVYHFRIVGDKLELSMGGRKEKFIRAPSS